MNQAHCLDLVQSWDEGAGLCVMQGVNEQHAWARLDLFLMALAELCVRYLSAQLLRPRKTHLFCNKKIWLLHQDLKKTIGAKWYHKTPPFLCQNLEEATFNWGVFKAASSCLSLCTWEQFAVLASNPFMWLPNNCIWFFHPLWRFKGCSCCCSFPPPCYPKQKLFPALNNLQKAGVWLARRTDCKVSGAERLWGETWLGKSGRSVTHQALSTTFSKFALLCFVSLRKTDGRWLSLTPGCFQHCAVFKVQHEQRAHQIFWVSWNGTAAYSR